LTFHELIHLRYKLTALLNSEISEKEILEFIEPDLQVDLIPRVDQKETLRSLGISEGIKYIDIAAELMLFPFFNNFFTGQYYV